MAESAAVSPVKREREDDKSPATAAEDKPDNKDNGEHKAKRRKTDKEWDALVHWNHDNVRLCLHPDRKELVIEALETELLPDLVQVVVGYCGAHCERNVPYGVPLPCTTNYKRICRNCRGCLMHCHCRWCPACHQPFDSNEFWCPCSAVMHACDYCRECCQHTCAEPSCGQMQGCDWCGETNKCTEHCSCMV